MVALPGRASPSRIVMFRRAETNVTVLLNSLLTRSQIVFAAPPDEVVVVLQDSQQIRFIILRMEHVMHGTVPPYVGIPARHEAAPAGSAYRVLTEGPGEGDTILPHETIQIRSHSGRITRMSKHITPPLVRIKNDDVRLFIHVVPNSSLYGMITHSNGIVKSGSSMSQVLSRFAAA